MGSLFKILIKLVAVVVLLVVVAAVVLPFVIDPNDYKEQIVALVEKQTGRELTIAGDLGLSVFPWLGLSTGEVTLSNAKGFGSEPFVEVEQAAIKVKLVPLLSKKLEVDTVVLDGLVLNLAKAKDGRTNWDNLLKADSDHSKEEHAGGEGSGLSGLSINGVEINDGRVSWEDRTTGAHYVLDQLSLNSGSIQPGRPVDLSAGLVLQSQAPELQSQVQLNGTVAMSESGEKIEVSGLRVTVDATGRAIPNGRLKAALEAAVALTLDGSLLRVSDLNVSSGDLRLKGDLQGSALKSAPVLSGKWELAPLNPKKWMASQGLEVPDTADPNALARLGATFALNHQEGVTRLDNVAVRLDDTRLDGTVSLKGAAIGFQFKVDALDLDRYLPPPTEESSDTQSSDQEPLLPVETLRALNLNGTLNIGSLKMKGLRSEGVRLTVKAKNGQIDLAQRIGKFYGGSYKGSTRVNAKGKQPRMSLSANMDSVQAAPLLKDLADSDRLSGTGQFTAKLNTSGNSVAAIKRGLNGTLNFLFEDGAVKGFNLAQIVRETKARFSGKKVPAKKEAQQTDFSELKGSGVITKGVLKNSDLLAKSPYLRVTGQGKVSLVPETLDYTVTTTVVDTSKGQGGAELEELEGVPIPVRMSGPYASPNYSVDWAKVLTAKQKAKLDEKKEELKEKLIEELVGKKEDTKASGKGSRQEGKKGKLEDQLKDKLKGLF